MFRELFEGRGIDFIVANENQVDDILMELSFEDLGKEDYEKNNTGGANGKSYAVYSDTTKGQKAIRKVCKELKIKFKEN